MKKFGIILALIIAVIGGGLFYLSNNLDSIAKSIIEKQGSAATKTTVSLDGITITLRDGQAMLQGLNVENPVGYNIKNALSAGIITVQVDPSSIPGNGPIIVRKVLIDGPEVSFITNTRGESNLKALEKNTSAAAGSDKPASGNSRKVIIKDLTISNGTISIGHELLQGKTLSAPLPTIHMTDIGKDSGGASAAQVATRLLNVIMPQVAKVASNRLVDELGPAKAVSSAAGEAVKGIGDKVQGLMR